jgi:DNA-binding transcriptional regulator YbjK
VAVAPPPVVAPTAVVAPKAVVVPKGAVTPKGERRRYALVNAAAELLSEGGFEAVRHRAVARRAGLPLASTTYYFSSLDDLIASAVAHIGMLEVAQLRAQVATLSRRRRSGDKTADLLVELLVGSESEPRLTEQLISRYERHIACTRLPGLREIQRRTMRQRVDAVADVIERSGRSVRPELVSALICTIDGAVVSALVDELQDPRAVVRSTVIDVIDAVAPFDRRPVRV